MFSDYFVRCVTGVNKIYSGHGLICCSGALPLVLESIFFFTDVEVLISNAMINIQIALMMA
jgi:hypothetical protein